MVLNLEISRKPRCEQYFELATSQPHTGMSHHQLSPCLEFKGMSKQCRTIILEVSMRPYFALGSFVVHINVVEPQNKLCNLNMNVHIIQSTN
jgi:hypothetical protein